MRPGQQFEVGGMATNTVRVVDFAPSSCLSLCVYTVPDGFVPTAACYNHPCNQEYASLEHLEKPRWTICGVWPQVKLGGTFPGVRATSQDLPTQFREHF